MGDTCSGGSRPGKSPPDSHATPRCAPEDGLDRQLYGDVWQWTHSPYAPFPQFSAESGAVGEYNGEFMVDQQVLRGGSCTTPGGHIRSTYRHFYSTHSRWVFSGVRLAGDGPNARASHLVLTWVNDGLMKIEYPLSLRVLIIYWRNVFHSCFV